MSGLYIIIAAALVFSLLGVFYTAGKKSSPEQFIASKNSVTLWATVATIVASGMGSWILFSPAETSVTAGISGLIGYTLGSGGVILLLAWLGKVLRDKMPRGHTLTEFVDIRYGKAMYLMVLIIMVFYMGVFLAAELAGMAQAAEMMYQIPSWITAVIIGISTLAYTLFGGIRATIFTDKVQTLIILPLLLALFIAAIVGLGNIDLGARLAEINPELMNPLSGYGINYGLGLFIAIIAAELFNQGNWQRVYIAKDKKTMIRAFLIAGIIILPIVFIAGAFGFFAVVQDAIANPSVSLFTLVMTTMPAWLAMLLIVLAVALIMSSMDTLLNGMVSLFTVNFARFRPQTSSKGVMSFAKIITIIIAGLSIFIATQGWSVLYLFLVADLVCVAALVPVFYGLFVKKHSGWSALIATVAGIGVGVIQFPDPAWTKGDLLLSFLLALGVSAVITVALGPLAKKFDMEELKNGETVLGK